MTSARLDKRFQSTALRAKMKKLKIQLQSSPFFALPGFDKRHKYLDNLKDRMDFFGNENFFKEKKRK